MPEFELTEAAIRKHVAGEIFSRGVDYFERGAIASLVRRGNVVQAEVEGSAYEPYRVTVTFGPRGALDAVCSCPYGDEWGRLVQAQARALEAHSDSAAALTIAEHGLTLDGYRKAELADWLSDLANAHGKTEQALHAAQVAFRAAPGLEAYRKVQQRAGPQWPERREELLAFLRERQWGSPTGPVEVFLREGLTGDALDAIAHDNCDYGLLGRVVDAAVESHPERVIPICRKQAESIMDQGQAGLYDTAACWLKRAKLAHRAAGRVVEWEGYLSKLLAKHQRKYKLKPLLEALRKD